MAVVSSGGAVLMIALGGRVSLRVWRRFTHAHNRPFAGADGVHAWNDLGFEDGGCVRVISFHGLENVVIPTGAWKDKSRSKIKHGTS